MAERAITFRVVQGTADRINTETGVIIRKSDEWYLVLCPTHGGYDNISEEKSFSVIREWATERVELMRENIAEAHADAAREDSVRMAESEDDDLIHSWDGSATPAACGADVLRTPYSYGSPEWSEVTCQACKLAG